MAKAPARKPVNAPLIHRCTALLMLGEFNSLGVKLNTVVDVLCNKWEDNHDPIDQHTANVQAWDNERRAVVMVEVRWPR